MNNPVVFVLVKKFQCGISNSPFKKERCASCWNFFSFLGRSTVELSMISWLAVIRSHFKKRCFLPNFIQRNTWKFKQQRTYYGGHLFSNVWGGATIMHAWVSICAAYSLFYLFFVSAYKFVSSFFYSSSTFFGFFWNDNVFVVKRLLFLCSEPHDSQSQSHCRYMGGSSQFLPKAMEDRWFD